MSGKISGVILVASGLIASVSGGCRSAALPLQVWVAGEMVQLTDRTEPLRDEYVFEPKTNTIRAFAGANETASFQIVIDSRDLMASGLRLSFSDLSGPAEATIESSAVRAYRMWAIPIATWAGWYLRLVDHPPDLGGIYDPLTPVDAQRLGQPYHLPPQGRLAIWVDVNVPRGALPGKYTGNLLVTSLDRPDWTGRVVLRVHDYVLPDAHPIRGVGAFDHRSLFAAFIKEGSEPYVPVHLDRRHPPVRRGLTIMRQLMRMGHEHRVDLFDRTLRPLLKHDPSGATRVDWTDYDAIASPYLTGSAFDDRIGCAAWASPFCQDFPDPKKYGGKESPQYLATAGEVISSAREHFAAMDQTTDQIFTWAYRGDVTEEAYAEHLRLWRIIRDSDPQTPILTQLPPTAPPQTGWTVPEEFAKSADIFAARGEWFDPGSRPAIRDGSHPLSGSWLIPGTPPYLPGLGVIATPSDVRAIPWFAMKYGCEGIFIPEVLNWSQDMGSAEAGSEARLFYPGSVAGSDTVLPSVRVKRLRRGFQDIAALSVLMQRNRKGIARSLVNAMVRYAGLEATGDNYLDVRLDGWVKDAGIWRTAQRLLAGEVQSAVHPETYSVQESLADQLAWREFDQMARTVRLERVLVRLEPMEAGDPGLPDLRSPVRIILNLELFNEYGRGADVKVEIESLPENFRAVKPAEQIQLMPPASRAKITLIAEGQNAPILGEGKFPIGIKMAVDGVERPGVSAYVPLIAAARTAGRITIDGNLDDWPMRPGNSGTRFKLIGRRGQIGEGLAERQTHTFVLRDEHNLYFAFRCEEPNPAGVLAYPNNTIHYHQLIPYREDLVELILDPGGKARTSEDLYHIAVKPNGIMVTERGIRTDPPLGQVIPWAPGARAAVGIHQDHWVAELSIPITAFGTEHPTTRWGINFTRFATQGAEASSWTGAGRYFYNPRGLGTLLVTPFEAGTETEAK